MPAFANATEARSVAENTAAGDERGGGRDGDRREQSGTRWTYSLEGTDASGVRDRCRRAGRSRPSRPSTTRLKSSYSVTVKADDGNGGSATVPVTITVTDVAEQPETADGAVGDGNCRKHHQLGRELDRAGH